MKRFITLFVVLLLALFFSGCAATRTTTTEHTAVEQALLSYTSRKAFSSVDFSALSGKSVAIERIILPHRYPRQSISQGSGTNPYWHEINPAYLHYLLERELLKAGASVSDKKDSAEISLQLVVDVAAIDDSEFVMGLPSVPIPIPGAGNLQTPEISIFSSKRQTGKVRFSVYGKDNATNKIAFLKKSKASRKYYTRWSMLLLLGWRVTDLGKPF